VETFLTRAGVPVHINCLQKSREAAVTVRRGALNLACCGDCAFIFNLSFDLSRLNYDRDYDNTQVFSPFFSSHQAHLIDYLINAKGLRNATIVEVGCGEGLFLRQLVGAEGCGNAGYGFDPAYAVPVVDLDGRLQFDRTFFGAGSVHLSADAILCRHMLGHVPDPVGLLSGIRENLAANSDVPIFIENQSVEWMLRHHSIWDFTYEQCSYFSPHSLASTLETAGFSVTTLRHLFNDQYLWAEGRSTCGKGHTPGDPGGITRLVRSYARDEQKMLQVMEERIRTLATEGHIALWGAAAKGVTLANLIDPRAELIACAVDLNPRKQGCFIPGTGHPIIGFGELPAFGVKHILVMNPNYRHEIGELLRSEALEIPLHDPYTME
jgi:SAM-dependent methyltransferase